MHVSRGLKRENIREGQEEHRSLVEGNPEEDNPAGGNRTRREEDRRSRAAGNCTRRKSESKQKNNRQAILVEYCEPTLMGVRRHGPAAAEEVEIRRPHRLWENKASGDSRVGRVLVLLVGHGGGPGSRVVGRPGQRQALSWCDKDEASE